MNEVVVHYHWNKAEEYLNDGKILKAIKLLHGLLKLTPAQLHGMLDGKNITHESTQRSPLWPKRLYKHEIYTRLWIATILVEYTTNFQDAKNVLLPTYALLRNDGTLDTARVYTLLGKIHRAQGNLRESLKLFHKALNLVVSEKHYNDAKLRSFVASLLLNYKRTCISIHAKSTKRSRDMLESTAHVSNFSWCSSDTLNQTKQTIFHLGKVFAYWQTGCEDIFHIWCPDVANKDDTTRVAAGDLIEQNCGALIQTHCGLPFHINVDLLDLILNSLKHGPLSSSALLIQVPACERLKNSPSSGLITSCVFRSTLLQICTILSHRVKNGLSIASQAFDTSLGNLSSAIYALENMQQTQKHCLDARKSFDSNLRRIVERCILLIDDSIRLFSQKQKQQKRMLHRSHADAITYMVKCKLFLSTQMTLFDIQNFSYTRALRRVYIVCKASSSYPTEILDFSSIRHEIIKLVTVLCTVVGEYSFALKSCNALYYAGELNVTETQLEFASHLNPILKEAADSNYDVGDKHSLKARQGNRFRSFFYIRNIKELQKTETQESLSCDNHLAHDSAHRKNSLSTGFAIRMYHKALFYYDSGETDRMIECIEFSISAARASGDKFFTLVILGWVVQLNENTEHIKFLQEKYKTLYVKLFDGHCYSRLQVLSHKNDLTRNSIAKEWQFIMDFL